LRSRYASVKKLLPPLKSMTLRRPGYFFSLPIRTTFFFRSLERMSIVSCRLSAGQSFHRVPADGMSAIDPGGTCRRNMMWAFS